MSGPNLFLKPISYPSQFLVYKITKLGLFLGSKREILGWKHPRGQILGKKGLKKKEIKEEKMRLSLRFVYLLFPSLFSSLLMVVFSS